MNLRIAILISNNGLGHIKRSIILAKSLCKLYSVTLFADKKKILKFKINKKIKIKNVTFNFQQVKKFYKKKIHKFIKTDKKYDLYLSDNYPEAVLNSNETFITSNFFWHDLLKINTQYYQNIEKRIKKRPIIPNYLFCSPKIKKKFKIKPVGFYGNFKKKTFDSNNKSILLSFGTADNKAEHFIRELINYIKVKNKYPIFIDSKFYNKKLKKFNIHKADYSDKMFSKIAIAIIKPGLGIIRDCLSYGISIICYENKIYNQEFLYNSKVLKKKKLSINFNNLIIAINEARDLIEDFKSRRKSFYLSKKLKWNGEKQVIKIIKKYFKDRLLLLKASTE